MPGFRIRSKFRDLKCFEVGGGKGVTHTELSNGLKHNGIQLPRQHLGYESIFGVEQSQ